MTVRGTTPASEPLECDAKLLRQPQSGPGIARNLGTTHARGTLVLYLDADVEVGRDLLERHLVFHREHPEVAASGGSVLPAGEPRLLTWQLVDHLSSWFNVHPAAHRRGTPEYLPSLNFCVKRDVVERHALRWAAGLAHTGEDVAYCAQLRRAGPVDCLSPACSGAPPRPRKLRRLNIRHMYRWGYHAPFVRGSLEGLEYGFLFPRHPGLLAFTLPMIVCGYTALIWKSWVGRKPIAVTLALPQILIGRLAYAAGVAMGTVSMRKQ